MFAATLLAKLWFDTATKPLNSDVYAVPDDTLVDHDALHKSWSCLIDCTRQLLPISLAFVMQYVIVSLGTFAMHLRMRYAAAQALYVDSLRQDTGNKELIA